MFFWSQPERPTGPLYDWLLANKEDVLAGMAELNGVTINDQTEFVQYQYAVSLFVVTMTGWTEHMVITGGATRRFSAAAYARQSTAFWYCTALTAVLGWWAFPWGPLYTIQALITNGGGGRKRTAASLLQLLEHGWDAPADATVTGNKKKILELSNAAAAEIGVRKAAGGFRDDVAIRIIPTKAAGEVRIVFDYPVSDGRDWVDSSQDFLLLIDKNDERKLSGCCVDFADGRFVASPAGKLV